MADQFDYVIVGAGSAGCVLAARLAEAGGNSICLLEAGPPDRNPFIHIPAGFMKTLVNPKVNWLYEAEPSAGTAGRRIHAPRGKTLGGSSSINGHIYNRGQRMDFDGWAQMGNRGWGYADILPYFQRTERRIGGGDDAFRGRDGGLIVTDIDWRDPLCDAFIEGAVGLGIPRNPDYNGKQQEGVGYFQRAIYKGRRVSAARGFLHPARKATGAIDVRTHAHATNVIFEGKRAVGVAYAKGGRGGALQEVRATKEVILCGGAVNSPQLLQLSGVGAPEMLKARGIEARHALKGVGENLRDHYPSRLVAEVKGAKTVNEKVTGLPLVMEALKYAATRKGVLALSPTLVHCFWKSNDALEGGDLQMTFTPASYKEGVQSKLDDFPGVTVAVWQQRPESTGHIRARSNDPFEKPEIQPNYLAHEIDRQCVLGGLKLARRLLATPELGKYVVREEKPGPDTRTDAELLDFARGIGTTAFHLMGTCRMGPETDPQAVVNDRLQVHGLEALRVVDASIMPTMPSANTNASTLMIAEKAADMILGRAAPEPAKV